MKLIKLKTMLFIILLFPLFSKLFIQNIEEKEEEEEILNQDSKKKDSFECGDNTIIILQFTTTLKNEKIYLMNSMQSQYNEANTKIKLRRLFKSDQWKEIPYSNKIIIEFPGTYQIRFESFAFFNGEAMFYNVAKIERINFININTKTITASNNINFITSLKDMFKIEERDVKL